MPVILMGNFYFWLTPPSPPPQKKDQQNWLMLYIFSSFWPILDHFGQTLFKKMGNFKILAKALFKIQALIGTDDIAFKGLFSDSSKYFFDTN